MQVGLTAIFALFFLILFLQGCTQKLMAETDVLPENQQGNVIGTPVGNVQSTSPETSYAESDEEAFDALEQELAEQEPEDSELEELVAEQG